MPNKPGRLLADGRPILPASLGNSIFTASVTPGISLEALSAPKTGPEPGLNRAAIGQRRLRAILAGARKAIVLGIGGGGDVVGALGSALLCRDHGLEVVLGGVSWERLPIDPNPGPRPLSEIVGARPLADHVVLAGPQTRTRDGALFAEAHMAELLGEETLLVDIHAGPRAVASSLAAAAAELGADLLLCVDVGGDVLGNGTEPGLASPLCDAVMLAASARLERSGTQTVGAVFGPCCDGELTPRELLERLATLAAAGGLIGAHGLTPAETDELERAVKSVPTEASAQAIRCARGELGTTTIRQGRRTVPLSPLGALTFYFSPTVAVETVGKLANAAFDTDSLEHANDALHDLGVRTELDFERSFQEA
jgi:hypothetical protein